MNTSNPFIAAIDGHSSCGKSTLAKELARHFDLLYVDTGAMYRCVTLFFIENNIDVEDADAIINALPKILIRFKVEAGMIDVILNDRIVSNEIRKPAISDFVSEVAAIKEVRKKLVLQQRAYGLEQSVIMDGRDIGTVVFPNAQVKFFLTASELVRAKRRHIELQEKNIQITFDDVLANIHKRDFIDSTREDSPLRKAKDAIILDNTYLSREEQFEFACQHIMDRMNP